MRNSLAGVVEAFFAECVPKRNRKTLVAISGGPDSFALLCQLHALRGHLGLELVAATVHHGLRESAEHDATIACRQAEALSVPCTILRINVSRTGNLMQAARVARYAALKEHAESHGMRWIAVGHTADDQSETVAIRLLRGTSLVGLRAIEPVRSDGVLRPLLYAQRGLVHSYADRMARRLQVEIACDPTNSNPEHQRTKIRALLNGDVQTFIDRASAQHLSVSLAHIAEEAHEVTTWLYQQAEVVLASTTNTSTSTSTSTADQPPILNLAEFNELPKALRRVVLRQFFSRQDVKLEHAQLEMLLRAVMRTTHSTTVALRGGEARVAERVLWFVRATG